MERFTLYFVFLCISFSMLNLSIATYNVRGLRNRKKCAQVIQWAKMFDFDILLLQETYLSSVVDFDSFRKMWGGPVYFSPSLSFHSGGVGIAFNGKHNWDFTQVKKDAIGRCISVLCSIQGIPVRICNVHAPNASSERKDFFEKLASYTNGNNPLILAGDFNCLMEHLDSSCMSPLSSRFAGRAEISELLLLHNLSDAYRCLYPFQSGHTWFCQQQSARIDRLYVPSMFGVTSVSTSSLPFSDHNPVYAEFQVIMSKDRGKGYWKYNVSLNSNERFVKDLRFHYRLWSTLKPGYESLLEWWDDIKSRIKHLSIRHGVRIARERRQRLKELQSRFNRSCDDEIESILSNEVTGAYIRSRVKFLEEGEKPSAFFFREEKRNARKKSYSWYPG